MKKIILLLLLVTSVVTAQESMSISGIVEEATNGETAFGASVYLKGTSIGGMTNEYGFYSISAPKGTYTLVVSYIGFQDINKEILLDQNQKLNFKLEESSTQLDEVIINADESEKLSI